MSSLLVPVATIESLRPHTNADALELATVLGWQLVVRKGEYQVGDRVVYFPIDTILPFELSEKLNVTKYLSKQRIRCARLRGEPSFGLAIPPDQEWEVGENVADFYGAEKYFPPVRAGVADYEVDDPLFTKYTEIENMRNFPTIFHPGEEVVITEKLHGSNSRVGIINGQFMAGSHAMRRKEPTDYSRNLYWYPLSLEPVRAYLERAAELHRQVIFYGEIYGPGVQSLQYGVKGLGYRVFDIYVDGHYLDWDSLLTVCHLNGIETVPELARIPYSLETVKAYSEGKTMLMEQNAHMREGVVVKPLQERTDPKVGRVVLKYVGDTYLFGEKSDYQEV